MQKRIFWPAMAGMVVAGFCASAAHAQTTSSSTPSASLLENVKISNSDLKPLEGTVSLRVAKSTDAGAMRSTDAIPSMTLMLKRTDAQQAAFDAYLVSLNDPASPNFHKWMTPAQVGKQYGPNDKDVSAVEKWLASQGLAVTEVFPTKTLIRFTGSVGAVQRAFHTQMHHYKADGKNYFANATEEQLPKALAPVVLGVVSLSNFFPKPLLKNFQPVKRNGKGQWVATSGVSSGFNTVYNGNVYYDVVPADLDTIYNVNPLWAKDTPIRGAGQTVAVLEHTNVKNADVATFRTTFLPSDAAGVFSQVHPSVSTSDTSCANPGTNGDEGEAALDAEWAGAGAPDANVTLASCADSGSDFGAFLAAQNLLLQPTPPQIMSLSYGECELISSVVGDATEAADLWSAAAAEGVTVFVSSADAGSAGCDQDEQAASFGIAVNGLGSTPYNVSVGGTDFDDLDKQSKYWEPGNGALGLSALSYIPEQTWNDSCASSKLYSLLGYDDPITSCNSGNFLSTAGGSGGPSDLWQQPTWQTGVAGMPQTNVRSIPDVSLFSANGIYGHALIYCMSDAAEGGTNCNYLDPAAIAFNSGGGTSFAAPTMAGMQALINQNAGVSHGNIAPMLYDFARKQYGSVGSPSAACDSTKTACVFHDVTVGDNDVPCFASTADCYTGGQSQFGVLSFGGGASLVTAWKAGAGYDYATGLGSVNVENLVNAVAAQDARSNIPRTWDLFGFNTSGNAPKYPGVARILDGHSNVLMISSVTGSAQMLEMSGGTVIQTNPWDNVFQPGDQVKSIPTDLFSTDSALAGQTVMESDNPITNIASLAVYSYGWKTFALPANPKGWALVGSGVIDGSGISREIWRNNGSGQLAVWNINCSGSIKLGQLYQVICTRTIGATIAAASGYTPRLADLNGDGYIDIVWTGPRHDMSFWINDGQGNFARTYGTTYPAGWTLEGVGEVRGSGKTDLIWSNASTSQMGWWIMDGATVVERRVRSVKSGYNIASIEDFDGDGLADILWTNASGDAYVWQGIGGDFVSQHVADGAGNPYAIPTGYIVQKNRVQGVVAVPLSP